MKIQFFCVDCAALALIASCGNSSSNLTSTNQSVNSSTPVEDASSSDVIQGTSFDPEHYEIAVLSHAKKRTYLAGSDFDPEGLQVVLRYKNSDVAFTTDLSIKNGTNLQLGQNSVTIVASGLEKEYPIRVREKYKIACVGDSLTEGHMWANQAYPVYLAEDVDKDWEVGNFGRNGISITGYGGSWNSPDMAYCKQEVYTNSIAFDPDVIAIMLGTNDATGWANAESTFESEYVSLLSSYIEEFPLASFIMMVSPPTKDGNQFGIPNSVIKEKVNPIQRQLAREYHFSLLDLREEFEATPNYESEYLRTDWNDGVHFSVKGAQYVAGRVWEIIQTLGF